MCIFIYIKKKYNKKEESNQRNNLSYKLKSNIDFKYI